MPLIGFWEDRRLIPVVFVVGGRNLLYIQYIFIEYYIYIYIYLILYIYIIIDTMIRCEACHRTSSAC